MESFRVGGVRERPLESSLREAHPFCVVAMVLLFLATFFLIADRVSRLRRIRFEGPKPSRIFTGRSRTAPTRIGIRS